MWSNISDISDIIENLNDVHRFIPQEGQGPERLAGSTDYISRRGPERLANSHVHVDIALHNNSTNLLGTQSQPLRVPVSSFPDMTSRLREQVQNQQLRVPISSFQDMTSRFREQDETVHLANGRALANISLASSERSIAGRCTIDLFQEAAIRKESFSMRKTCNHCQAKLFDKETPSICCNEGKVHLAPTRDLPEELLDLYLNNENFKKNIRKYNSSFAFTSLGANVDENLASSSNGVYTFKIKGQMFHKIGSLLPANNEPHKFAQIYFLDEDAQTNRRSEIFPDLNGEVSDTILRTLNRHNPYVQLYQQMKNVDSDRNFSLKIKCTPDVDLRRYNAPTASEVAVLMVDSEQVTEGRDIVLRKSNGYLQRISELNQAYDPLSYPLLFPRGESGWHKRIPARNGKCVTLREWVNYYLMIREYNRMKNPVHLAGRLTQQYCVDQYAKIEQGRLAYFRTHQREIRSDLYQGLQDALQNDGSLNRLGRRIVLPSSFQNGPRAMNELYQDSMSIVRKFGKPDLFITVTCNPNWTEIQDNLLPGQSAQDRPDLTARVFNEYLKRILNDLVKKEVLGKTAAHIYVIEFQKRGLPHAHILLILSEEDKIRTPEQYDKIVCAELPDRETQPELYEKVTKNMIHGPKLVLKVGMPIMLLRNLNPSKGLCNGTRLIIKSLQSHVIEAEISIGKFKGKRVFIPRITLSPSSSLLPFILKRRQFPIRLCFAMTINKSQGQTLQKVGLYLPTPVFSHGQLYVALSRVKRKEDMTVLILNENGTRTKNIVYTEVYHRE